MCTTYIRKYQACPHKFIQEYAECKHAAPAGCRKKEITKELKALKGDCPDCKQERLEQERAIYRMEHPWKYRYEK